MNNTNFIPNDIDYISVGQRIKSMRKQAKLSQERLSEILNYTPHYIYQIESATRKPSINALYRISNYFNVPIDFIIKGYTFSNDDSLNALLQSFTQEQRDSLYNALNLIIQK